jgi:hypothetical protein
LTKEQQVQLHQLGAIVHTRESDLLLNAVHYLVAYVDVSVSSGLYQSLMAEEEKRSPEFRLFYHQQPRVIIARL